jgi:lysophospholipase L1-like esterase
MTTMHKAAVLTAAFIGAIATAIPAYAQTWTRSWESAMQGAAPETSRIAHMDNATLRQVVRTSVGGSVWRIEFSNENSPADLMLGSVHVALQGENGAIEPGTDREVHFHGSANATIASHGVAISDAITLPLRPLSSVVVSLYFPHGAQAATFHGVASATGMLAPGNQTTAAVLQGAQPVKARAVIDAIDVDGPPRPVVVALGDSITDGVHSTPGANNRWPDLLAERLQSMHIGMGVANAGIASNQLLRDGVGPSGVSRFAHDALAAPGVTHVVLLEGINDIGIATNQHRPLPTPDALIGGYRQIIAEAHAHHVKVILGTLLPYKGAKYWSAQGNQIRQAVNRWIRTGREADGVVDFDHTLADPADQDALRREFASDDDLHPNDNGYRAMAEAVDTTLLR